MFSPDQYELLDFGDGRKLEQIAGRIVDRPCPAADGKSQSRPEIWKQAEGKFIRAAEEGHWQPKSFAPDDWHVAWNQSRLSLKPTKFGHLGLFAEQAENWQWITKRITAANQPKILNLFGYTGGSTLAAAAAGAEVVHVDAAKNVVQWARRNAELSGLADAPIRWIAEDATKFVERELKRDNKYDAVILDPPSYGHGPKGEVWKVQRDLMPLLRSIGKLTEGRRQFILLTCHSPGFGPAELQACLSDTIFGSCQAGGSSAKMQIATSAGRKLSAGAAARWP
jgi:23S rRNA (cytosine1962-C5)-methyltransferase